MNRIVQISIILFLLTAVNKTAFPQQLSNMVEKTVQLKKDTIRIDSLFLVPGTVKLFNSKNETIPDTLYEVIHWKSLLIPSGKVRKQYSQVQIKYRTFPKILKQNYSYHNFESTDKIPSKIFTYQKFTNQEKRQRASFSSGGIIQSGSIARGITAGNNQDAVVNSTLDLQLSGALNENLNIVGAISDENIPIQPDGTTQKIEEFDKVFIKVYNEDFEAIGGDFTIKNTGGQFMRTEKKTQGAGVKYTFNLNEESSVKLTSQVNGAISKGKYCSKNFMGQEGNQGPYRLTGCDNERQIIILSGSEKVYIDGKLMKRGKNNDYVIDYNTAELTFTTNQMITKDKRIRVEYEYSLKEYARFLLYSKNTLKSNNGKFWVNFYSEKDSKRQTLGQELSTENKRLLAEVGDNLDQAVVPNVDTTSFQNDLVLYKKIDTLVNGITYEIYKYSTNPNEAIYEVGFSYTGANNGNYILSSGAANGRVYKWVAPKNGIPQGEYSPVKKLIPPQKQQLLVMGGKTNLSPSLHSFFEFSFSNNDINTFSLKDKNDDKGYAFYLELDKIFSFTDTSVTKLKTGLSYRHVNRYFTPLERFRAVEFDRNWNLKNTTIKGNENLVSGKINFYNKNTGNSAYSFEHLSYKNYTGNKNRLSVQFNKYNFKLLLDGDIVSTNHHSSFTTDFITYNGTFSKSFSWMTIGIKANGENNQWKDAESDSLLENSFAFNEWQVFIESPDTNKNQVYMNYLVREDDKAYENKFRKLTKAENINAGVKINTLKNHRFNLKLTYRRLNIKDSSLTNKKPEDNLLSRFEHKMHLLKNFLSTSTFYELGSGLEAEKEFNYIEVPGGQGVYTWSDYNNNDIKELNEFEKANFSDEANYIRIFRPSGNYYKTHTNEFNQLINLKPSKILKKKSFPGKFLSRFSNQFAYRIKYKKEKGELTDNLNPFGYNLNDPRIISQNSNFRNTLSFNKLSQTFHIDYTYLEAKNKSLLMNGTEIKKQKQNKTQAMWNISETFGFINDLSFKTEKYNSEYFQNKNYKLDILSNRFTIRYNPFPSLRLNLHYEFANKNNLMGAEKAVKHEIKTNLYYSKLKNFSLQVNAGFIYFEYNEPGNTAIAYQILKGLKPGKNGTWELSFQKGLYKNLDLRLNYQGRISEEKEAIHTGQVELRANF